MCPTLFFYIQIPSCLSIVCWKDSSFPLQLSYYHPCWNQLTINVWVYFSILFCWFQFLFLYLHTLSWLPWLCNILKLGNPSLSSLFFFSMILLTALGPWHCHKILGSVSISAVDGYSVQSVNRFGEYCHLNNFEFSDCGHRMSFCLFMSSLLSVNDVLQFALNKSFTSFVKSLPKYFILFVAIIVQHTKLLQLCLTLCDPKDCSLPAFSVHGILQARILKWVAMPSFRGSFWPRDWTLMSTCIGRWALYH